MKKFRQNVLRFIEQQQLIPRNARVLVACSGGVDSIALLHFLAVHREKLQIEVGAVHIDHMLRGQQSAEDACAAARICEEFELPFFSEQVPVPEILQQQGGNVQTLCRQQRYEKFQTILSAHSFDILATGHHADDQLETVLIQLSKGQPLNGMPAARAFFGKRIVRPLLAVKKEELYSYAAHYSLAYREDPSNETDDYLRNRLRHHAVPLLNEENPSAALGAVRQTMQRQADEQLLSRMAEQQFRAIVSYTDEQLPTFGRHAFLAVHDALQKRVIQLLLTCLPKLEKDSSERYFSLVEEILRQIKSSAGNRSIDIANGYQFVKEYDKLLVTKKAAKTVMQPVLLEKGQWQRVQDCCFYWQCASEFDGAVLPSDEVRYFQLAEEELPLLARQREDGDRLHIKGMAQAKRLSRILIDDKVPHSARQKPVIATASGAVCAMPGVRYGRMFTADKPESGSYIWIARKMTNGLN